MRASEPLKSKRVEISLLAWSTAFLSSTLLTSEVISKDGMLASWDERRDAGDYSEVPPEGGWGAAAQIDRIAVFTRSASSSRRPGLNPSRLRTPSQQSSHSRNAWPVALQ